MKEEEKAREKAIKEFIENNYYITENGFANTLGLWARAAIEYGYKLGYEAAKKEQG